jgi:integrase
MHEIVPEHRIKVVRFNSGERFPVVLDRAGMPLCEPVPYLWRRRNEGRALNTLESNARTLAMVHDFFRANDIDFRVRVPAGRVLDQAEASALADHLRTIGKRTETIQTRLRAKYPDLPVVEIVNLQEWHRRRWRAAHYVEWLVDRVRRELDLPTIEFARITDELEKAKLLIFDGRKPPNNPPQAALSLKESLLLLDTIRPGSDTNPFPEAIQFRNFAMISTYWENGLRRSEVLGLKGVDLSPQHAPPTLNLVRHVGDDEDSRARPPSVKTMPRIVPITPLLHGVLWEYLTVHRRKLEVSFRERGDKAALRRLKSHSYIFVGSQGAPLSQSGVYKIFETLRMTLRMRTGGLPVSLTPHALRRTWNDMFTELGRENLGPREAQIREYLMGWVRGSKQPAHYARQSTQREAARLMLEMQRQWMARGEEMKR